MSTTTRTMERELARIHARRKCMDLGLVDQLLAQCRTHKFVEKLCDPSAILMSHDKQS